MLLETQDIKKSYQIGSKKITVLKGVNLEVREKEIIAIMGKSGAGKSTLLNVLGTLDRPDSGKIFFLGKNLSSMSSKEIARFRNQNIGFVFQFHYLLPEFNSLENVMMPGIIKGDNNSKIKKRATELLERVGLGHRLHHKSNELSGGEQQRVAFARALMNNPKLILADEPSGNLDSSSSEKLHEIMWSFAGDFKTTFIVVTHDDSLSQRADRIVNLVDGVI